MTSKNIIHFSTVDILVVELHSSHAVFINPAKIINVVYLFTVPLEGSSRKEKLYFVIKERKSKRSSTLLESKAESHCKSK